MRRALIPALLLAAAAAAGPSGAPAAEGGRTAVRVARLHLADGRALADAVVILDGGRVAAVGTGLPVPRGTPVVTAPAACPGFADLWTVLPAGHDGEDPRPWAPALRAVDGFDPADGPAAAAARGGVLRRLVLPADRNPLGGRAAVLRPDGPGARLAAVVADAGGTVSVADAAARRERHPGSLAGLLRALDAAFEEALGERGPFSGPDPGLELGPADLAALRAMAGGGEPVFLFARSRPEVRAALSLAARRGLRPVLVDPRCGGPEILAAAAAAGLEPAGIGAVLVLDPADPLLHLRSAGVLAAAGVRIGFGSGGAARGPAAVRLMASLARRHGLPAEAARRALLGGGFPFLGRGADGLAAGDPADLVLLDGDPADPASRVTAVMAGGRVLGDAGGAR